MGYFQFATTTQFYLYGKRNCTLTGWERARKRYPQPDLLEDPGLNLAGKVYMVTGANGGIGKEITRFLASKGAMVYMLCRNAEKAAAARETIAAEAQCPTQSLQLLQCDCSLEGDVRRAWDEFNTRQKSILSHLTTAAAEPPRLDGLICNAGALLDKRTETAEGVEITFASHLLFGTYLLGSLAMPSLEATPGSRLVAVSSGGMYNSKFPSWDVATSTGSAPYDGQFAYAYAKRGQVLLCEKWTVQHPKVKFVSCHPGWTLTEGVQAAYGEKKSYLEPMRSLWQGAEGICWLCVAPPAQLEGGAFYLDRSPQPKHLAGPFFSEGTYTKNTAQEVDEMMRLLQQWSSAATRPSADQQKEQVLQEKERKAALSKPLQAMSTPIKLQTFMGRWYVLANIPTPFEVGTRNCIETYSWDEHRKTVEVLFEFNNKGAPDSSISHMNFRASVANAPTNTHWALCPKFMGVHWPVNLAYLILHLSEDATWCMVGEPRRSNVWIMTRDKPRVLSGGREPIVAALASGAGAGPGAGLRTVANAAGGSMDEADNVGISTGAGVGNGAGNKAEAEAAVKLVENVGVGATTLAKEGKDGVVRELGVAAEVAVLQAGVAKAAWLGYNTEKIVRIEWTH